jgi:hypothetical protein
MTMRVRAASCRWGSARAISLSILLGALAATASAQLISIKTVPLAQGDQFAIFPSLHLGMGSVAIALPDTLLDPFRNPATGGRVGARFLGTPSVYSVSNAAGGGRTLPLAAFTPAGNWYAGLAVAFQEVDPSQSNAVTLATPLAQGPSLVPIGRPPSPAPPPRSHGNAYAFALLGRGVPEHRLSLAASVFWARLAAVDGIDLFFPGTQSLTQFGHAVDVRLGVLKEWAGDRSLEAVALRSGFGMTDDANYLDAFWDPGTQSVLQRPRTQREVDRTDTWGLHLQYRRPLTASGWRVGWLATANLMSHPKIPNFGTPSLPAIANLPWDPGHSRALNLGVGLSRTNGPATFGIDVIYEPIWSNTWGEATTPSVTAVGDTIPVGGRTIDNHFRFSNALLRMGVSRDLALSPHPRTASIQLGLTVRRVHYWLTQDDHLQVAVRNQEQWWAEWTPTWGLTLRFPELELRYSGRVTNGMGRPGVQRTGFVALDAAAVVAGGLLVAPSGPFVMDPVSVVTHQVSLSFPLR